MLGSKGTVNSTRIIFFNSFKIIVRSGRSVVGRMYGGTVYPFYWGIPNLYFYHVKITKNTY